MLCSLIIINFYDSHVLLSIQAPAHLVITSDSAIIDNRITILEGSDLLLQCTNINELSMYTGRPTWISTIGEDTTFARLNLRVVPKAMAGTYKCKVPRVSTIPIRSVTLIVDCKYKVEIHNCDKKIIKTSLQSACIAPSLNRKFLVKIMIVSHYFSITIYLYSSSKIIMQWSR